MGEISGGPARLTVRKVLTVDMQRADRLLVRHGAHPEYGAGCDRENSISGISRRGRNDEPNLHTPIVGLPSGPDPVRGQFVHLRHRLQRLERDGQV